MDKLIQCLIIDDEPPARDILRRYIQDVPSLELVAECGHALQAIGILQHKHIDLMFLDIRMPQLNGTDFIKSLVHPPKVIFTTAFSEYALESYDLDIIDYLMKPIRFERFLKAVNKAYPLLTIPIQSEIHSHPKQNEKESFVYFRADRKMVKVLLDDILYIESMKDYIKVVTTGSAVVTKQSISSVEALLPETKFVRTHRSFIISLNKIKSYTQETIEICNTEIPIGKLYRIQVLKSIVNPIKNAT